MSMTVQQIITKCAADMHDDANATWPVADYYRPIYQAEQAVKRRRPAAFYNTDGSTISSPVLLAATSSTLAASDSYFDAICHHVMGSLYLHDSAGRFDSDKSAAHYAEFEKLITGKA